MESFTASMLAVVGLRILFTSKIEKGVGCLYRQTLADIYSKVTIGKPYNHKSRSLKGHQEPPKVW